MFLTVNYQLLKGGIFLRAYDIIAKKKNGKKLRREEIEFLVNGYTEGDIPDYQVSAWAMAVIFQGMDKEETAYLTDVMAKSGDRIDLSPIKGVKVDKHSTGGVGDKTTLVLAPLVAACGVPVAKMSGKGLGHTGGTIDKLEAIPGFKTSLQMEEFINNVNEIKVSIAGQTGNLAPADKKIYALRDVTATVDSIPLIASSIMSKKIASGADGIVLDVKVGSGAFMKEHDQALELAQTMVEIGKEVGRDTVALVSNMDQPLGLAVGNSLEVIEAIETLQGKGPKDLTDLSLNLAAQMIIIAGVVDNRDEAINLLKEKIESGAALAKLKELIAYQSGNSKIVDNIDLLPLADKTISINSQNEGYITRIEAEEIGLGAMLLGAGRENKDDKIDYSVGIKLNKKAGDSVDKGDKLATIYYNQEEKLSEVKEKIKEAYTIKDKPVEANPLIYDIIN